MEMRKTDCFILTAKKHTYTRLKQFDLIEAKTSTTINNHQRRDADLERLTMTLKQTSAMTWNRLCIAHTYIKARKQFSLIQNENYAERSN